MSRPNPIRNERPLRGEEAFVYGLKYRAKHQHCLGYGTFSLQVDRLEILRKQYSRVVTPITYVPLFIKATGLTLAANPEANAILFRRMAGPRIVRFERVDVCLPIARRLGERQITFVGVIRDAPAKPLSEIQAELKAYQTCLPDECHAIRRVLWFDGKPLWLARLVHWRMGRSPRFYIRNVGTCGLTLLHGDHERVFPIAPSSSVFGLGAARREPVVRRDEIGIARVMKCSLMVDNYVVSGALGERLVHDFKTLLETGSFVEDELRTAPRQGALEALRTA